MLGHKKVFIILIIIFSFCKIYSLEYPFQGKKYIEDTGHIYTFTNKEIIEDYWTKDNGWQMYKYTYKVTEENTYLKLYIENQEIKETYYMFLLEDKHIILLNMENEYEIKLTLMKKGIDESYILPVFNCDASSYLTETLNSKTIEYIPDNIRLSVTKNWVEGVDGSGIDEFISFSSPGVGVKQLYIINGFFSAKKSSLYYDNNRVRIINVIAYDNNMNIIEDFDYELQDTAQFQKIPLKEKSKHFKLTIKSVYKGRKYDDTAICGIYVDGLSIY